MLSDNEIIKALDRLKKTKDFLRELYQKQVKKCPYPELKPLAKQTYEGNKNAFNIAIKAIEENIRQKAEIERLKAEANCADGYADALVERAKTEAIKEFAEKLIDIAVGNWEHKVDVGTIDNLVKEMVGAE